MSTPSDLSDTTLDWQTLPSFEETTKPAVLDAAEQAEVNAWLKSSMVRTSLINKLLKAPRMAAVFFDWRRLDPILSAIDLANEKLLCTHNRASEKLYKELSQILTERGFPTVDTHATIVALQMYEDELEKSEPVGAIRKKVRGAIRWIVASRDFLTEKGWLRDRFAAAKSSNDYEKEDLYAEEKEYHINIAMNGPNAHLYEHYLGFKKDEYSLKKGGQYERVFRAMSDIRRLLREYDVHDVDLFGLMHHLHNEHEEYISVANTPEVGGATWLVSNIKKKLDRILDVDAGDLWREYQKRRDAKFGK